MLINVAKIISLIYSNFRIRVVWNSNYEKLYSTFTATISSCNYSVLQTIQLFLLITAYSKLDTIGLLVPLVIRTASHSSNIVVPLGGIVISFCGKHFSF